MSRHRNVRALNYSDEYEGFDDVYGHSVEDDYSISPSDADFMYDRNNRSVPQMSAYLQGEREGRIDEEEEGDALEDDAKPRPQLSELDEARLRSCLDEVRNVIGDALNESVVVREILTAGFDCSKALDALLTQAEVPKPQRARKQNTMGEKAGVPLVEERATTPSSEETPPTIRVATAPANAAYVTKGFELLTNKIETDGGGLSTPRSQSPLSSSGRNTPEPDRRTRLATTTATDGDMKVPIRIESAESAYRRERGGLDAKEQLHLIVIGHVDAGKSTLMGHLLYRLGHVNQKTMHKYEQDSKKIGKQSFAFAWILDETGEERTRGITMDVGQSKFETETKVLTVLDAPGHKDFIPNMIKGAAQADVALLVVDATRGEFETGFESGGQTREHALLVRSLGVSQLIVVVNKLDTVGWSEERFSEIATKLGAFLRQAGFREGDVVVVPCSGLTGENMAAPAAEPLLTAWYSGPHLLQAIDRFKAPERPVTKPLRFSVNDVFKGQGSGFTVSGRVETGIIRSGDKVLVQPQNQTATVRGVSIDDMPTQCGYAGDSVSVTVANFDQQNMVVGSILCDPANPTPVSSRLEARIVVFNAAVPITNGFPVILHHQSLVEQAWIRKLVAQLHRSSGAVLKRRPRCLPSNSSALVIIETSRPIALETYKQVKELGRFMLRVAGATVAAGLVTKIL